MFQDPPKMWLQQNFLLSVQQTFLLFIHEKNVESQRFLFWTENHDLSICLIFKGWIIPTPSKFITSNLVAATKTCKNDL